MLLVRCQDKGLPGAAGVGGWRTGDGNSRPDHRESPCKFWDGRPAVVAAVVGSSDMTRSAFWQRCTTYFVWFCLWTSRWETSRAHVLERSWGSEGPEGGDLPKCHVRLAWVREQHAHHDTLVQLRVRTASQTQVS